MSGTAAVNPTGAARSTAQGGSQGSGTYTASQGDTIAQAYMAKGRLTSTSITPDQAGKLTRAFLELNNGDNSWVAGLPAGTYQLPTQAAVDAIMGTAAAPADAEPATSQRPAPANNDTVETPADSRPAATVTGAAPTGAAQSLADANARIASLEARLGTVERQNRQDAVDLNRAQSDYKREIARQETERTKPGFMDAAMEVSEFFMRMFSPFFNLISAIVRVFRILWKVLIKKEEVDWTSELIRLAGDIAGIMPGLGWVAAVTDQAMDVWDSSKGNGTEILGWRREKESVLLHAYQWGKEKITGEKAVENVPPEMTDTQPQETFAPAPVEA